MSGSERIVAVVVTWNRKELLRRNLRAVLAQTRPVDEILVVDNASTDGTPEMLAQDFPMVRHVRLAGNAGAAGGMHVGVREGLARGADWLWLMDDDGVPSPGCLAEQLRIAQRENYALCGALLIDITSPDHLAFAPPWRSLPTAVPHLRTALGADHFRTPIAGLWNGTLLRCDAARAVGLPKAEMFIWGEEIEYGFRLWTAGYRVGVAANADYLHPPDRFPAKWLLNIVFWRLPLIKCRFCDPMSPRAHIHARNLGYIDYKYAGAVRMVLRLLAGLALWSTTTGPKGAMRFFRYYIDGVSDRYALEPSRDDTLARLAIVANS